MLRPGRLLHGEAGFCMPCSASRDVEWSLAASGQRSNALHIPSLFPLRFLRCCRVSLATSSSTMDFSSATHLFGMIRPQSRSNISSSSSWRPSSRCRTFRAVPRQHCAARWTSRPPPLTRKTSPSSTSSTHFLNISEPCHSNGTLFL